jgi:uncharacterized membrane protein YqjE
MLGVVERAKAVTERLATLARLNLELAKLEGKAKAVALAIAAGLGGLTLLLLLYAIGFSLAAAAVGLAEAMPLWAALLVVTGALLVVAAITGYLAYHFARKLSSPLPSQAIKEMEATIKTLESHV